MKKMLRLFLAVFIVATFYTSPRCRGLLELVDR